MPTKKQIEFERYLLEALHSSDIANTINKAIINGNTIIVAEKFNNFNEKISLLETEIAQLKIYNDKVVEIDKQKEEQIYHLERRIDILEQQVKQNNIRLSGVKEIANENTLMTVLEIFTNTLKLKISESDIISASRVGQIRDTRSRHIVVSFKTNKIKNVVYHRKKFLQGTGMAMKEDLSMARFKFFKAITEKYGYTNVWTSDGTVFAKTANGIEVFPIN